MCFMMWRIMRSPTPSILIFERCRRNDDEGNIRENIRPKKSFFTFGFTVFLMTFRPQNVKNIDTF